MVDAYIRGWVIPKDSVVAGWNGEGNLSAVEGGMRMEPCGAGSWVGWPTDPGLMVPKEWRAGVIPGCVSEA